MDASAQARRRRGRTLPHALLAGVLLASLAAGCISRPDTSLRVREGDLVEASLLVADAEGVVFPPDVACDDPNACEPPRARYVVDTNPPPELPDGWQDARPLPPGVAAALTGLVEGESVDAAVVAFGKDDPSLVREHARVVNLTRFAAGPDAYGRAWFTERLVNGTHRIEPGERDRGATLEVPRWCNERFCLFRSTLVGWNATHLTVRHEPAGGARVHVPELDAWLTVRSVAAGTFTVDGNDPRAGRTYRLQAAVHDVRAPPQALRRAPPFTLTTLGGEPVTLDELRGQPVILEFFASWCPSCIKNTEHLALIEQEYADSVAILAVDVDPWESNAQLQGFVREHGVTWPIALDKTGEVSRDYRVGQLSTEVIIDAHGNIVHVETGVADHARVSRILHGLVPAHAHAPGEEHG